MQNEFIQLRTGTSCGLLLTRNKPSGCIKFGGLTDDPLIFQEKLCSTDLAIYNTAESYTKTRTVPQADPHSAIALLVTTLRKQDEAHSVCVALTYTSEQNYIVFGIPSHTHTEESTQLRVQAAS
jgi:hypothetical protein